MSQQAYYSDVTASQFQAEVLERSMQVPVLVDFWADWCQPCKMLMPILQSLAEEYAGRFFLAKVNTDVEQALAAQAGVRSLPTVMLFKNGQVVDHFMGVQPESEIRALLDKHIPKPEASPLDIARDIGASGDHASALEQIRALRAASPDDESLKIDEARELMALGDLETAETLLQTLPLDLHETPEVAPLKATLLLAQLQKLGQDPKAEAEPAQMLEQGCAQLMQGQAESGFETLLQLMRQHPKFGDGAARQALVAGFTMIGNDPVVTTYRKRMMALLY